MIDKPTDDTPGTRPRRSRIRSGERIGEAKPKISNRDVRRHSPREVAIYDRGALLTQLELAYGRPYLFEKEEEYGLAQPVLTLEEQSRLERLRCLAEDDRGPNRNLLFGTPEIRDELVTVRADCPNFTDVVDLVDRAVALSIASGAPVSMPPILLSGPPGCGKTYASKAIANALGVAIQAHSCATNSDAQQLLVGHPTSWKGARMSIVNEMLLSGGTAQPVLLLDEIDKFQTHRDEQPYHTLLNLLEAENSQSLLDEYLRLSFDLSRVIIIATANDVDALPAFIRDRLLAFDINPPTGEALFSVTRRIAMIAVAETNGLMGIPADAIIQRLARAHPRRIARIVRLALGYAACAGRDHLTVDDVDAADGLASPAVMAKPIGFLEFDQGP